MSGALKRQPELMILIVQLRVLIQRASNNHEILLLHFVTDYHALEFSSFQIVTESYFT